MFRKGLLFVMIILSLYCLLILAGGFAYSDTILPSTQGNSELGVVLVWSGWTVLVAIPIATMLLLVVGLLKRRGD